ncbi:MAG: tetratricopeptide repeat protein [Planctomycetes bacterium]|nr:tetratricopeptide repeat protein [Planctomycetota bacterium]
MSDLASIPSLLAAAQFSQAAEVCTAALAAEPGNIDAHNCLAYLRMREGRFTDAITHARAACDARPQSAPLLANLARALSAAGLLDETLATLDRASAIEPGWNEPHILAVEALMQRHRYWASAARCDAALSRFPNDYELTSAKAEALASMSRATEAIGVLKALAARHPTDVRLHSNIAHYTNYPSGQPPAQSLAAHQACARVLTRFTQPIAAARSDPRPPVQGRPLRVGLMSPDLCDHSVAFFIEPFLAHHDRARIELFAYFTYIRPDAVTRRLRALADHWRSLEDTTRPALAAAIAADQLDVLIDLAGHTRGHSLDILRCRLAPTQITYLGYPNTTGLPAVGYRFVDSLTDPPGASDTHASEKLIRIDPCFLCYQPPANAPPPSPHPSMSSGHVTFGSFNNLRKLSDASVDLFAAALQATPNSRLLLKAQGLDERETSEFVASKFAARGVSRDRLDLVGYVSDPNGHLGVYGRIDIALDSTPYNGTTTTCEALWMGVPVITLAGDRHAARVGVSLLTNIGLPELIASTPEQFASIAAALAGDPARLASLRSSLRGAMQSSPLLDAASFCGRFTRAIELVASEPPRA